MSKATKKVEASKEVCALVETDTQLLRVQLTDEQRAEHQAKFDLLEQFLAAAKKRLPHQKAIDADRQRKNRKKASSRKKTRAAKKALAGIRASAEIGSLEHSENAALRPEDVEGTLTFRQPRDEAPAATIPFPSPALDQKGQAAF